MKKKPSLWMVYLDLFFDGLGILMHYGTLLFLVGLDVFIIWLMQYKLVFSFSLMSAFGYTIMVSILFFTLSFYIFHYIYIKNMNIDLDVIRGKLTVSKALKLIKEGKNLPPLFRSVYSDYMGFGSVIVFKNASIQAAFKDIDIEKIPTNMKRAFSLFFITIRLTELFFVLFLFIFFIVYLTHSKERSSTQTTKTYTLADALKRVCEAKHSKGVYFYRVEEGKYIFTLDAPLRAKHLDFGNAIYVDQHNLGMTTHGSSIKNLTPIKNSVQYFRCNNKS